MPLLEVSLKDPSGGNLPSQHIWHQSGQGQWSPKQCYQLNLENTAPTSKFAIESTFKRYPCIPVLYRMYVF